MASNYWYVVELQSLHLLDKLLLSLCCAKLCCPMLCFVDTVVWCSVLSCCAMLLLCCCYAVLYCAILWNAGCALLSLLCCHWFSCSFPHSIIHHSSLRRLSHYATLCYITIIGMAYDLTIVMVFPGPQEKEFGYHPAFKRPQDTFSAIPFRPK